MDFSEIARTDYKEMTLADYILMHKSDQLEISDTKKLKVVELCKTFEESSKTLTSELSSLICMELEISQAEWFSDIITMIENWKSI